MSALADSSALILNPLKKNVIPFSVSDRLDDGRSFFYYVDMKPVSDEMLMLYIWEGINDALGTDSTEVSEDAECIYNGIRERLADKGVIRKEG